MENMTAARIDALRSPWCERPSQRCMLLEQVRAIASEFRSPKDAPIIFIIREAEQALGLRAEGPLIERAATCFDCLYAKKSKSTARKLDSTQETRPAAVTSATSFGSDGGGTRGSPRVRRQDSFGADMVSSRTANKEWSGYLSGTATARSKLFVSGPDGNLRPSNEPKRSASWQSSAPNCRDNSLTSIGDLNVVLIV